MVIATGLILGAVAVVSVASHAEDLRTDARRRRVEEHLAARPPDPLSCSTADRRSIVMALGEGFAPDVATAALLRCDEAFAYGTVCLMCGTSPGAIFGVLLKKETGGGWRYLGSGDSTAIEQVADDAGLERSDLDQLRRGPTR